MRRIAIEGEYFNEGAIWLCHIKDRDFFQIVGRGRVGLGRLVDFATRTRRIAEGPKGVALEVLQEAEKTIRNIWRIGGALSSYGYLIEQDLGNPNLASPKLETLLRMPGDRLLLAVNSNKIRGVTLRPEGVNRPIGSVFLVAPEADRSLGYSLTKGGAVNLHLYLETGEVFVGSDPKLDSIIRSQILMVRGMYRERNADPVISSQLIERETMIAIADAGRGLVR